MFLYSGDQFLWQRNLAEKIGVPKFQVYSESSLSADSEPTDLTHCGFQTCGRTHKGPPGCDQRSCLGGLLIHKEEPSRASEKRLDCGFYDPQFSASVVVSRNGTPTDVEEQPV